MSTLIIRKKSLKTWLHTDSILGNFIISKFYFNADNLSFQIVEQGQSRRVIYNISDITLYALPTGGTAETFGNITELSLRLEELNYPAFQYDGQITSIANLIDAGTGVTITGDGTEASPYVINSTAITTPDATTSVKGKLKLAGDLSGTADLPTVPALSGKQATLVSGTNIKTVNGNSLLGSGDIVVGGGGSQTLAEVLAEGNTTGGENIVINDADSIQLENTSSLQKGTYNFGGNGGISRICSNNYEDMWQNGFRHVFDQSGFIRNSTNCFDIIPDETFDDTLRFRVDSLWTLDDGTTYKCTDATTGAAVWDLINTGRTPTLQEVLDNNHDLVDGNFFAGTEAGDLNTGINVNALGENAANNNTGENVNAFGNSAGLVNSFNNVNLFGNSASADEDGQTVLSKDGSIMARISTFELTDTRNYKLPDAEGTFALLSDIPTSGGGIPHATASGTDTYTATITGVAAYNDADAYLIRFTNGNTSSATLNINGLGAIPLYRNNDGVLIGGDIISGGEMLCVYNSTNNHFQVIGTAPNSLFAYVTNADSVTITKGMPVYAFSGTGDRMTVKRANNSTDATSAQTVGLVLSTSIAANQKGLIMMQGLLDGLSILPTSTFADGDAVYLGATAGTITNVKPYAPNHLVYLGVVTTASNGSAGRMYVRVQNGYELSEIHDIDLITNAPTNNQVLTYESSTDLWKNKSLGTILGYTPYRNVQTSQTVHTGTTAETVLFTATIPAGAFNSTDVIKVLFGANKTTALGTYVLRLRINTTNTISGAPTIAYYSGSTTAQVNIVMRNFNLNGGNLYGFPFLTTSMSDIVAQGASLSSTTLNPANQFYIFATIVLNNSGDSIIGNMLSITN